jgi:hypothetical protein
MTAFWSDQGISSALNVGFVFDAAIDPGKRREEAETETVRK